ncbi:alkyl hydroperoxide reductase, partial [Curtobacterium luteum]
MRTTSKRLATVAATAVIAALALAGCSSSNDALTKQYGNGTTQNYISGNGAVTEVAVDKRTDPISFDVKSITGERLSSKTLKGKVVVV